MNNLTNHIKNILNNNIDTYNIFKISVTKQNLINGTYKIINNEYNNEVTFDDLIHALLIDNNNYKYENDNYIKITSENNTENITKTMLLKENINILNIFNYIINTIDFNQYRIEQNNNSNENNIIDLYIIQLYYKDFIKNIYDMTYNLKYINKYHDLLCKLCNNNDYDINLFIKEYYENFLDDIKHIDVYNYNINNNNNKIENLKKYYNKYHNKYENFINSINKFK